jgi:diguanylate cyclase (GGDEF)-like protein
VQVQPATRRPATDRQAAAGDVVPLSRRVAALSALRIVVGLALVPIALLTGWLRDPYQLVAPVTYIVVAGLLGGAVVLIRSRGTAVAGFGLLLCLDGVAVQAVLHWLAPALGSALVLAVFLTAVCLLGSFRTGIKIAIWQSLLIVMADRGSATGLLPAGPDEGPNRVTAQLILIWVLVLVVCVAASINERELRRRRYDAEALQTFAAELHQDDDPELVLRRTLQFVLAELDAGRALACTRQDGRLRLLLAHGTAPVSVDQLAASSGSPLLDLADTPGHTARLLSIDPDRDEWLATLLPDARRLIVLPLGGPVAEPAWVVFEHRGSGIRVERRVVATAGQASATAALALSRAALFRRSQTSAITDQLTGLPNRRAYDQRLVDLAGSAGDPFALILADIDRFKSINDRYGHQVGDEVLHGVARRLAAAAPPGAMVARHGGEEFAVLLPLTTPTGVPVAATAAAVGEQLRTAVAEIVDPEPVTASFGVAVAVAGLPVASIVSAADAALYRAKGAGRNRVVVAD